MCVCVCVIDSEGISLPLPSPQPGLESAQEEWGLGRHRHMHDINTFRCQRQPMYGRDLVQTILSLCRQEKELSLGSRYGGVALGGVSRVSEDSDGGAA